jgi:hypothetical protein
MNKADHDLIQDVLDGGVRPAAFASFQERLRTEPEFSVLYREYALLHHSLCEEFEAVPISLKAASYQPARKAKPSRMPVVLGGLGIAAALVLSVLVFRKPPAPVESAPTFAKATFSEDAMWEVQGEHKPVHGVITVKQGGVIILHQGQAKLELNTSATALLEGPAALTFVSDESFHLERGSGRFRLSTPGKNLTVTTPTLTAVDLGTEFGVIAHPDKADELHVIEGRVRMSLKGKTDGPVLTAGQAGRIIHPNAIERFDADESRFKDGLIAYEPLQIDHFDGKSWDIRHGEPSFTRLRITGRDFQAFRPLPSRMPDRQKPILLATMTVETPDDGEFHTDGWAGLSFLRENKELLFFGDSHGGDKTWSIDIKQDAPVVLPEELKSGPATVTMRYDFHTGEVTLHEGGFPLPPPFCTAQLPPGTTFDEIRLGASPDAAIAVSRLELRLGAPRP